MERLRAPSRLSNASGSSARAASPRPPTLDTAKSCWRLNAAQLVSSLCNFDDATLAQADGGSPRARVAIVWTRGLGAESCISPDDLVERTRARVPAETLLTLERPGADFVLDGRIERRGGVFRTELTLRETSGGHSASERSTRQRPRAAPSTSRWSSPSSSSSRRCAGFRRSERRGPPTPSRSSCRL